MARPRRPKKYQYPRSNSHKEHWWEIAINPQAGCKPVSEGCDNCLAAFGAWKKLKRTSNRGLTRKLPSGQIVFTGLIRPQHHNWDKPLDWSIGKRIYVGASSDLFLNDKLALANLQHLHDLAVAAPQHIYIFTTRYSDVMRRVMLERPYFYAPNIWPGVSVESQAYSHRIDDLFAVPATVRVIAAEPLLGPLVLPEYALGQRTWVTCRPDVCEVKKLARPCLPEWVYDLRAQCLRSNTAFFFVRPAKRGHAHPTAYDILPDGRFWQSTPRTNVMDAIFHQNPRKILKPRNTNLPPEPPDQTPGMSAPKDPRTKSIFEI
jgi:protein gp37